MSQDKLYETDAAGQLVKYRGVPVPPNLVATVARSSFSSQAPRANGAEIIKAVYRHTEQLLRGLKPRTPEREG